MTASPSPAVLIMAAGRGTRMKSALPKVLHNLMGHALVEHVLNAALYLAPVKVVVVTGFEAEAVENRLTAFMESLAAERGSENTPELVFARQEEQLGTGHAVSMAREALEGFQGPVLIMSGDVPLISPNTLDGFLKAHETLQADISVLTVRMDDPAAYGRIIRDEGNWLEKIVEYRDASEEQRSINEVNSGFYVAESSALFRSIASLSTDNEQNEYYLTDVAADFRSRGLKAAAIELPRYLAYEAGGINDRYELAEAQAILKDRINESWMRGGVTMLGPVSTHIETTVRLANDVTLWPGVILTGKTVIGEGAEIGPYCRLHDCRVEAGAKVAGNRCLDGQTISAEEAQP